MELLKEEMQLAISHYSNNAIARYERSLMPMTQSKRIEARARKQNLIASLARLDRDPSGASVEKAREELNYSRNITWAMQCMMAPSHHVEIKSVSKSRFLEELQLEAARFDNQDATHLTDRAVAHLMAIATLVDTAAEVTSENSEYGSCLFSSSRLPKTIRMPFSVLDEAGCEYVLSAGQAFIKRGSVYLEIESIGSWGIVKEIHLSGKEFTSSQRAEMEYLVELEADMEYLVMGSMTPKKFMEHCNFRKEINFETFEPFSLLDDKRINKWIDSEGGGLLVEVKKLKYHTRRIHAECTWLFMEDGKLITKRFTSHLTRRIDVNVTTDPGIVVGASSTWTEAGGSADKSTSYLMNSLRRGSGLSGNQGTTAASIAAHALIMINNYHRPQSGSVLSHKACLYNNTGNNGVQVPDTRWLSARLAGWDVVPSAEAVLDPNGDEFQLVKKSITTGIAHAARTGYLRIEHSNGLSNMTKVYGSK